MNFRAWLNKKTKQKLLKNNSLRKANQIERALKMSRIIPCIEHDFVVLEDGSLFCVACAQREEKGFEIDV